MYSPLSIAPGGFANGDPGSPDNCAQARRRCSPRNRRSPAIGLPVQPPTSREGLHRAVGALEFQDERERSKKFLPSNAGKAWSNQEDAQICEELRRGMTFEQIAQIHNRTTQSHQWFHHFAAGAAGKDFRGAASPKQWQAAHLSQSQFQAACRKRTVSISLVWEAILPRSRIRRP